MSFIRLEASDFVISADSVTAPAWSTNIPTLTTFYMDTQLSSSFYVDVYNAELSSVNSAVQFSIAYGRSDGSGSAPFNVMVPNMTPKKVTFSQYKNLIFGDVDAQFDFGYATTASNDIFVIAVDRNRYKESLFPGTFNLTLSDGTYDITITDNSKDVTSVTYLDCGRKYDLVLGRNGSGASSPVYADGVTPGYTRVGSYGYFLPDVGLIVLNPAALRLPDWEGGVNFSITLDSTNNTFNEENLFTFISNGSEFQLNSKETISSNYVFLRTRNADYNYTTNPSFISGSGDLVYSNFIYNPQTFPTTVGLYNDNNELLAVAKLSKPLPKDFTKESLIRVKLDW